MCWGWEKEGTEFSGNHGYWEDGKDNYLLIYTSVSQGRGLHYGWYEKVNLHWNTGDVPEEMRTVRSGLVVYKHKKNTIKHYHLCLTAMCPRNGNEGHGNAFHLTLKFSVIVTLESLSLQSIRRAVSCHHP